MATDYASITELKERVGANNLTDPLAQQYLDAAARVIDEATRRPPVGSIAYSQSGSETRYYDDDRRHTPYGLVTIDDLLTVSEVRRAGQVAALATYQLLPYNVGTGPYTSLRWLLNAPAGTTPNMGITRRGIDPRAIQITGVWGYCLSANRPPAVKEATLQLATLYHQRLSVSVSDLLNAMGDPGMKELHAIMRLLVDSGLLRHYTLIGA